MQNKTIGIIGLGYVGLPLAVAFARKRLVVGYDINPLRIAQLNKGHDPTLEVTDEELQSVLLSGTVSQQVAGDKQSPHGSPGNLQHASVKPIAGQQASTQPMKGQAEKDRATIPDSETGLIVTGDAEMIRNCQIYIVTVPTPVDKNNHPDLSPLVKASEMLGKLLKKGDLVIYESTVYPGATEEECVPVMESVSGLKMNEHFFVGYSPERINPGDKVNTLSTIKKVTAGSTPDAGLEVDALYREIITAGTHLASTIRVAEAAKVIENAQRDINIAFVNELSKIFNKMGIDTLEVLEAAGTKWNFLPFRPGLVGGHCIGVDPYYLAQKAQQVGYHPEIILAGRRLNDGMGAYVAGEVLKLLVKSGKAVKGTKTLMLGITFKENCPDIRNTRAIDIYHELLSFGMLVDLYDPWANPEEVKEEYGIDILTQYPEGNGYGAIILAVAHQQFQKIDLLSHKNSGAIIYDVKGILPREWVDARL